MCMYTYTCIVSIYVHKYFFNSFLCITHLKTTLTACAERLTAHISMTLHIHMYIDSIYVPRKKLFIMCYTSENDTYRACNTSHGEYLNDATH